MAMKKVEPWTILDDDEIVGVTRTSATSAEIVCPFAVGEDEHGEMFVGMHVTKIHINPANGASKQLPWLRLMLPGVCGHYECGGMVEVSMN